MLALVPLLIAAPRTLPVLPLIGATYPDVQPQAMNGATLATSAGKLPFADGALALRGETPLGGLWQAMLPLAGWRTFDLSPYLAHGAIEMDVRGEGALTLVLRDRYRAKNHDVTATAPVAPGWSHVRLPLSRLFEGHPEFHAEGAQLLIVQGSQGATDVRIKNLRIASPDDETELPAIKTDQVGYRLRGAKVALVSGDPTRLKAQAFSVIDSAGKTVLQGELEPVADEDPVSGDRVLRMDFSALRTPGTYRVRVAGLPDGLPFVVAADPYAALRRDAARYFYLQRSGLALDARHAGPWARGEGHPQDRHLPYLSDPARFRDVHGGWYDAGDYGKYVSMASIPVSDLLYTQELFPKTYPDGSLNLPESGNGVPDLLDEARWELDFFLRMQDAATGGFYPQIWPNNADATPDKDLPRRFVYDQGGGRKGLLTTYDTATASAVLAHASRLFAPYDRPYAARLLKAAESGWGYLAAHPTDIRAEGMTAYMADDRKGRLWAAGELFRATGGAAYGRWFAEHGREFASVWEGPDAVGYTYDVSALGWIAYLRSAAPDPALAAWFRPRYSAWRMTVLARADGEVWRNFLTPALYVWGSNAVSLNVAGTLALGDATLGLGDAHASRATDDVLHYLLGTNPRRFSYVSGEGADSVRNVYSQIYSSDGIDAMPPGYLAGGANGHEAALLSRWPGKCYRDSDGEWTVNENAIYWNSALVLALAAARR